MDACDQFLLAGLRRKIGPDGDVQAAHRAWYADRMREHDQDFEHMLLELSRREAANDLTEPPPSPLASNAVS